MERQKATEELENWKEQQKQKAEDVSCSNEWISFFFHFTTFIKCLQSSNIQLSKIEYDMILCI